MNTTTVIYMTLMGFLLLYLINRQKKDVKSGKIDKQSVFLSVSLLNLLHAVIEDTILMALIGGHISGILFARIIFSLIVSYFIFMIYKRYFKVV